MAGPSESEVFISSSFLCVCFLEGKRVYEVGAPRISKPYVDLQKRFSCQSPVLPGTRTKRETAGRVSVSELFSNLHKLLVSIGITIIATPID